MCTSCLTPTLGNVDQHLKMNHEEKSEYILYGLDNFILKMVSMCRKVSEVPPGYLLLVSFKIVRLATVLLGTFKTFKTTH